MMLTPQSGDSVVHTILDWRQGDHAPTEACSIRRKSHEHAKLSLLSRQVHLPDSCQQVQQGFLIIIHASRDLRPSLVTQSNKGGRHLEADKTA
ncbi:hypothetical protein M433DRAFT_154634 [Acidomyces richmondensis BFW]|nr:MAG: hypothetical protein FE78DRAFT_90889 [Acidomyces sp. 'richmondensis']KYG45342.1 hypothetical protein M433DRAFT_154634 [Acidomyces richmondensis BFW]